MGTAARAHGIGAADQPVYPVRLASVALACDDDFGNRLNMRIRQAHAGQGAVNELAQFRFRDMHHGWGVGGSRVHALEVLSVIGS